MKYRFLSFSFLLSLLLLSFLSCQGEVKKEVVTGELGQSSDTIKNEYAKGFQLIYSPKNIKINILDPLSGELLQSYLIGKGSEYKTFGTQIKNIVALSTTHVGMLRKLNIEDQVTGVSSFNYLCHPLNNQTVKEVGDIGLTDPERIMKASPDIIFYSGYNLNDPLLNKLEQANLKTFLIYDWKEIHPLGRVEWLKVFGVLFNKEKEANSIYAQARSNYYKIQTILKQAKKLPTVLAGTYFGDVFNVPAGGSYMAQLIKDANANYVYAETEGVGSLNLGLEEVITKNIEVDYWLNASASTMGDLLQQSKKFKMLKSVKNYQIFTYFNNVNCFWENSPVEPDKVLEDLGRILHPELMGEGELNYYSKLED